MLSGGTRERQQMSKFEDPKTQNPLASFEKSKKYDRIDKIDEKRQAFTDRRKQAILTLTGPYDYH